MIFNKENAIVEIKLRYILPVGLNAELDPVDQGRLLEKSLQRVD